MARNDYSEDEIIHLDFDDGEGFDCGIIGVFAVEGQDYIALEALDGSDDVYLYGYRENGDDFDLIDIEDQETFDKVAEEFDSLMDEPL
ncbi:MAG: DUF1292 domain-containing protein [Oscillospiraceae bacterium]|jgi:hypothetical protein|nr:DUF1292 domain-containing protein [Oscillospiraceae bacterium]